MKLNYLFLAATLLLAACDKQKDDLVEPLTANNFPQVITFGDEGDGDLEDEDKFSFKLKLNDRVDPEGKELGGKIVPLTEDVVVNFEVADFEGFTKLSDYIKDAEAFYEIDDCTTSADGGINLNLQFDVNTGKGSVRFPKGVEELEIEFETDEDLFNDDVLNTDDRTISFVLTGITGGTNVTYNKAAEFKYEVLDDEAIHGEWELDASDAAEFAKFKTLFGLINEEVKNLDANDVEGIKISIEYNEVQVEIELKETEMVTECGDTEEVNKVIEIEAGIEELDLQTLTGAIEFADDIEDADGAIKEFVYKGGFEIVDGKLMLTLEGEFDDNTTDEITLVLEK